MLNILRPAKDRGSLLIARGLHKIGDVVPEVAEAVRGRVHALVEALPHGEIRELAEWVVAAAEMARLMDPLDYERIIKDINHPEVSKELLANIGGDLNSTGRETGATLTEQLVPSLRKCVEAGIGVDVAIKIFSHRDILALLCNRLLSSETMVLDNTVLSRSVATGAHSAADKIQEKIAESYKNPVDEETSKKIHDIIARFEEYYDPENPKLTVAKLIKKLRQETFPNFQIKDWLAKNIDLIVDVLLSESRGKTRVGCAVESFYHRYGADDIDDFFVIHQHAFLEFKPDVAANSLTIFLSAEKLENFFSNHVVKILKNAKRNQGRALVVKQINDRIKDFLQHYRTVYLVLENGDNTPTSYEFGKTSDLAFHQSEVSRFLAEHTPLRANDFELDFDLDPGSASVTTAKRMADWRDNPKKYRADMTRTYGGVENAGIILAETNSYIQGIFERAGYSLPPAYQTIIGINDFHELHNLACNDTDPRIRFIAGLKIQLSIFPEAAKTHVGGNPELDRLPVESKLFEYMIPEDGLEKDLTRTVPQKIYYHDEPGKVQVAKKETANFAEFLAVKIDDVNALVYFDSQNKTILDVKDWLITVVKALVRRKNDIDEDVIGDGLRTSLIFERLEDMEKAVMTLVERMRYRSISNTYSQLVARFGNERPVSRHSSKDYYALTVKLIVVVNSHERVVEIRCQLPDDYVKSVSTNHPAGHLHLENNRLFDVDSGVMSRMLPAQLFPEYYHFVSADERDLLLDGRFVMREPIKHSS